MERLTRAQLDQLRLELAEIAATTPRFIRHERNQAGRDFVIGDVHGAFDSVLHAMKLAGFDRTRDRLFSVGDLVDRGVGSHRAGRFLAQPYVYAVPGNHEVDLIESRAHAAPSASFTARFPGAWTGKTSSQAWRTAMPKSWNRASAVASA